MSHCIGIMCETHGWVIEPDNCPEGCPGGHGYTFESCRPPCRGAAHCADVACPGKARCSDPDCELARQAEGTRASRETDPAIRDLVVYVNSLYGDDTLSKYDWSRLHELIDVLTKRLAEGAKPAEES